MIVPEEPYLLSDLNIKTDLVVRVGLVVSVGLMIRVGMSCQFYSTRWRVTSQRHKWPQEFKLPRELLNKYVKIESVIFKSFESTFCV